MILEAAIVLPLLLVLFLGILEAGRAMMVQQTLTAASQYGARVAIVQSSTVQNVYNAVDTAMASAGIVGPYQTTITPNPPSSANVLDPVTVGVSINYKDAAFGLLPDVFVGLVLRGRTSMAKE